jgi:peptide/nickel transport system substrate-binding protein
MTRLPCRLAAGFAGLLLALGAAAAHAGGTLEIGTSQDTTIFDPILISQNADRWVAAGANATLVRVNLDGTAVEPDLAESWEVSGDGLVYTFHLRPDLKFSDGSPITGSDVEFSLERLRDTPEAVFGGMYAAMRSVETPDDRTVVITLSQPTAPFLARIALLAAAILPEAQVRNRYDEFLEKPIGAGAFRVAEWRRGEYVALEKNPYFWGAPAKPKLDRVEWRYIPNDDTRIRKLRAGEIDAMTAVPLGRIEELRQEPGLAVHLDPSAREHFLLINHAHPPLDDRDVRTAICMAIDLDAIVQGATFGVATPADGYIPEGSPFHNPAVSRCPYDPGRARRALADAGVKDLRLKLLLPAGDATDDRVATLIRSQLAKIGVTATIETLEPGLAWEAEAAGDYDLSLNYWADDIIDPDEKTSFALYGDPESRSYHTGYRNPAVSRLIDAGRIELDPEKREAIYFEIQAIAKRDLPWIDLYYSPYRNASRSYLRGFAQNPLGSFMLEDADIVQ